MSAKAIFIHCTVFIGSFSLFSLYLSFSFGIDVTSDYKNECIIYGNACERDIKNEVLGT